GVYTSLEELQRQTNTWLIDYLFELYAGWHADEKEEDYLWALSRVAQLFDGVPKSRVIVTDRELALM
ncbi:29465_t:CDS:2, partial [Racocetra persica]